MNSTYQSSLRLAVVFLAALTLSACGPAKYNLNRGKDKKGDSLRTESKMALSDGNLSIGSALGRVSGKMDMTNQSIKVTKTLETDDKGASAIEVFHETDLAIFKANINGEQNSNEQKSPLHGTTVVRRRTGDTWSEALKGGTPTPEQKKHLDTGTRSSPSQYPDRELTVGETWTVSADTLKRLFGDDMLSLDGKMTCTFVRVEELNGQKCAVILTEMDAKGSGLDKDSNEIKITLSVHGSIYRSLERSLDLKTEMKGNMKWEGDIIQQGQAMTMTMTGPVVIEERTTILQ